MSNRGKHEGTISRDGRGWRGSIMVHGVRKYRRGRTKREVVEGLADLREEMLGQAVAAAAAPLTVAGFLAQFLRRCEARVRAGSLATSTYEVYRSNIELIVSVLGAHQVGKLNANDVMHMHEVLLGRGLGRSSVGQAHRVLKTALQTLVKAGELASNPVSLVKEPKARVTGPIEAIRPAEVRRLIAQADPTDLGCSPARVAVSAVLGLRQTEALGLLIDDVDLLGAQVHIRQRRTRQIWLHGPLCEKREEHSAAKCPVRVGPPTTDTTKTPAALRTVPIPTWVVPLFAEQLAQIALAKEQLGNIWVDKTPWLFPGLMGAAPSVSSDTHRWARLVTRVLGEGAPTGTHAGRRCAATRLAEANVPIETAKKLLGWASGELMQIYAQVSPEHVRAQMMRAWDDLDGEQLTEAG